MRRPAENWRLSHTLKTIHTSVRSRLKSVYVYEPLGVSAIYQPDKHVLSLGFINFDDPRRQVLYHLLDGPIPVTGHKQPTDPVRNPMQPPHAGRELTSSIEVLSPFPAGDVLFFQSFDNKLEITGEFEHACVFFPDRDIGPTQPVTFLQ